MNTGTLNGTVEMIPETDGVGTALDIMTTQQVADMIQIAPSSVSDYARRKHNPLPSFKVGKHRRYWRGEVITWLEALGG